MFLPPFNSTHTHLIDTYGREWDLTVFFSLLFIFLFIFVHVSFYTCSVFFTLFSVQFFFFGMLGIAFGLFTLGRGISRKVQVGLIDAVVGEIKDRNSMEAMCLVLSEIWVSDPSGRSHVKVIIGLSCGTKCGRWLFLEIVSELGISGWHKLSLWIAGPYKKSTWFSWRWIEGRMAVMALWVLFFSGFYSTPISLHAWSHQVFAKFLIYSLHIIFFPSQPIFRPTSTLHVPIVLPSIMAHAFRILIRCHPSCL